RKLGAQQRVSFGRLLRLAVQRVHRDEDLVATQATGTKGRQHNAPVELFADRLPDAVDAVAPIAVEPDLTGGERQPLRLGPSRRRVVLGADLGNPAGGI